MQLLTDYVKYFGTKSKQNDFYGLLSGHVIVGQLIKHINIPMENYYDDCRVHLFLIQKSGTGKTAGSDVYTSIIQNLGLSIHSLDDFSDASAAGTVIQDEEHNNEVEEREGFLSMSDFIHSDEASTLFDPASHQKKMLLFIQKSCNPIDSASNIINRSLSPGSVQTRSTTSYILTTFPPEKRKEVELILNNGLMQRMFFYPRILDSNTLKEMSRDVARMLFKKGSDSIDLTEEITEEYLVEKFLEFKEWTSSVTHVEIPDHFEVFILQKVDAMYDHIEKNTRRDDIREKMYSFINRWIVMLRKMATHSALLNRRTTINRRDMQYAWKIIREIMTATRHYIEQIMTFDDNDQNKSITNHEVIYNSYLQLKNKEYEGIPKGFVAKSDLMEHATLVSGNGDSWFNKERKSLDRKGFIEEPNIKTREKYYKIIKPDHIIQEPQATYQKDEPPQRRKRKHNKSQTVR